MTKKIKVKGVRKEIIIPHKYQVILTFKKDTDITPLLLELCAKKERPHIGRFSKIDMKHPPSPYEMELSKKFYLAIDVNIKRSEFALTIGYNDKDKRKIQKILAKFITLPKTRKK